jgi:hypothetical protein
VLIAGGRFRSHLTDRFWPTVPSLALDNFVTVLGNLAHLQGIPVSPDRQDVLSR